MKQFNLEEYLENGGDVVTRSGLPVEILKTDMKEELIVGVITLDNGEEMLEQWQASGHYYEQDPTITPFECRSDLMIKEQWYNNIPKGGILCWCPTLTTARACVNNEYHPNQPYPFTSSDGGQFQQAQPVKPEELIGGMK